MAYESVRGMRDILPDEADYWTRLEATIRKIARRFNYREIRPPLVEHTELFSRGIGAATDVVNKEMYTFPDKKGRSLTLRPEATASVVRAYVEHGMTTQDPFQKLYYIGPMFRYEKPQKGRSRQFHQYGVEAIGSLDPSLDVEVISLAWSLMHELGLGGLSLRLNSIGCAADHERYREALRAHFAPHIGSMCEDCQRRYDDNPLRILDCKNKICQPYIADAPGSTEHLCDDCADHFERVKELLDQLGLDYVVDPHLVRGFDYYTRTVFELTSKDLGAQDALLGGGRYDDLVKMIGGPDTPGVGFAGGMERLILVLKEREEQVMEHRIDLFLVTLGDAGQTLALDLSNGLRGEGLSVDLDYRGRSFRKQMTQANKLSARYLLVLGDDEATSKKGKLKEMDSGEETEVALSAEEIMRKIEPLSD
ncbi:MAG TPA: histidine--tRNA ligase [Candidatus Acetothermia bacterium]|nr:histidine--tRNA ligase [Candidatus Acetothermia bacterium]